MFDINGTLLLVLISFVIFMGLMKTLFFEPVAQILNERATTLDGDTTAAKDAQQKHQEAVSAYDERLRAARQQAQALIQEQREEARAKAAVTMTEARTKAQAELASEMEQLAQTRQTLYDDLKQHHYHAMVDAVVSKVVQSKSLSGVGVSSASGY